MSMKKRWIFVLLLSLLFNGCTTIKYVPIETVKMKEVTEHDSIYFEVVKHDSVTIAEKGDTVYVTRWHTEWRDRWRDRCRDSVRVDTVAVPYPVEKELSWWQCQKIAYGEYMIAIAAVLLAFALVKLWK